MKKFLKTKMLDNYLLFDQTFMDLFCLLDIHGTLNITS